MRYVCRTAKNTQLYEDGLPFSFADLCLQAGGSDQHPQRLVYPRRLWPGDGDCLVGTRVMLDPIFLVTNFELPDEAVYWYKKRFQIETFFSDEKSRGFYLHKSHLSDPQRLSTLMIAACLAYLWIVYWA